MSDVGREIRRLREAKGWGQTKLAAAADMAVSGVSQIENGHRNPNSATLIKLARALGVEVADLFPKKAQAPLFREQPEKGPPEERRAPPLLSWTVLVRRLAERWEEEIAEREQEWQAADPAVRKHVKRLPNLGWAVEISQTSNNIADAASDELESAVGVATTDEALELFRALKRLDKVIDQARAWFDTAAEGTPPAAKVYDFQEALKRMERKIGARAS